MFHRMFRRNHHRLGRHARAWGALVLGGSRVFRSDAPIKEQGVDRLTVRIGDDCWIGSGATITAGVSVGQGSIVPAGSVVTRDVPPNSVVAGVPARVISSRLPKSE